MRQFCTAVLLSILVAVIPTTGGEGVGTQECYVCRGGGGRQSGTAGGGGLSEDPELAQQFPGQLLPLCGREPAVSKSCPKEYSKGCYTETRGDEVLSKKCSGVEVSDCQEANHVKYCYCTGQLCNGPPTAPGTEPSGRGTSNTETDDEDLTAGSGDGGGSGPLPPPTRPPERSTTTRQPEVKLSSGAGGGGSESGESALASTPQLLAVSLTAVLTLLHLHLI